MTDLFDCYRPVCDALNVRDLGNGRGRGMCPVHGDQADLWVAIGEQGKLLVRCYPRKSGTAACRTDELIRAAGLDMRYLFPDWRERLDEDARKGEKHNGNGKPGARKPVRDKVNEPFVVESEHDYYDRRPDGTWFLAFRVVKKRFESGKKDYPQKRPNPAFDPDKPPGLDNPEWLWGLNGARPVLYRWRELEKALAERGDRWVLVVEGEKDVETARWMGLTATCNPGGVGKFNKPHLAEPLKGRNVIVIPDEDAVDPGQGFAPGIRHAQQVCRALLGVAHTIKFLRFPDPREPGWDLTDWRTKLGETPEKLRGRLSALIDKAPLIKTEADVAAIEPLPWTKPEPAPAPERAAALPPQNAPAVAQDAPGANGTAPAGSGAVRELAATMAALEAAGGSPRSFHEWLGDVWLAAGRLTRAVEAQPVDAAAARRAALAAAAVLLRGLDRVPELGGRK